MKIVNVLAVSALILGGQPLLSDFLPEGLFDQGTAFAKSKGNKGNSGKKDKSLRKPKKTNASYSGNRHAEQKPKEKNLRARLKGLNSLNRSIDGLMNSSDPKMDLFREFVIANADYEAALAEFTGIPDGGSYAALVDTFGFTAPFSGEDIVEQFHFLTALAEAAEPVESDYPDYVDYLAALSDWEAATAALGDSEVSEMFAFIDAASEDAMIEAMVAGLNATGAGLVTTEDMDPDMIEWVSTQMGVGDADGFIDAYLAEEEVADDGVGPV